MEQSPSPRAKLFIAFVVLILIGAIAYLLLPHKSATPQTVEPATAPANQNKVTTTYSGDDTLVQRGLYPDQVEAVKIALTNFATSQHKKVQKVAITDVTHTIVHTADDDLHVYGFTVAMDNATYLVKIDLVSDMAVRLHIFNPNEPTKEIYDSHVIDLGTQSQD